MRSGVPSGADSTSARQLSAPAPGSGTCTWCLRGPSPKRMPWHSSATCSRSGARESTAYASTPIERYSSSRVSVRCNRPVASS